jgi:hypothetical protein
MKYKPAAAAALALLSFGAGAAPALARTPRRPTAASREHRENAAIKRALQDSSAALRVAHDAQRRVGDVASQEARTADSLGALSALVDTIDKSLGALTSSVASITSSVQSLTSGIDTLNSEVNDPSTGLSALNSRVNGLNSGLGALSSQVNDPNSGLGKVDDGVLELIVTPSGSSTPEQIGEVFAPDIPQVVGAGSTASGTVTYPCTASGGCTFSLYAADDSNRPQPSGGAAAYVGGTATVTSDGTGSPGSQITFVTAGQTPANSSLGGSPLVAIPSRSPLGSKYPYPGQSGSVLVPIQTAGNGSSGTLTVPQGVYTLSATINFIGKLG